MVPTAHLDLKERKKKTKTIYCSLALSSVCLSINLLEGALWNKEKYKA